MRALLFSLVLLTQASSVFAADFICRIPDSYGISGRTQFSTDNTDMGKVFVQPSIELLGESFTQYMFSGYDSDGDYRVVLFRNHDPNVSGENGLFLKDAAIVSCKEL